MDIRIIPNVRYRLPAPQPDKAEKRCCEGLSTATTIARSYRAMKPSPLRYGWLKKAFDAVQDSKDLDDNRSVFSGPDAIARFGVGKNMVSSMRHWAYVSGIVAEPSGQKRIETTALGQLIFGKNGLDPYMEDPATSWLIHWHLCGWPTKTTWFWTFHHLLPFHLNGRR